MRKILYAGVLGLFYFFIYTSQVWADMPDSLDAMKVISGQDSDIDVSDDVSGDERIGLPEAIYSLQNLSYSCGAFVAPGVWKEFDCYNLAAIGKKDGADPFTPSWKLIGGYWQWGRKGPDPSVWFNTNTKNFAHGPTGPSNSEANEEEISGWDQTNAPDGAWSDSYKTSNDPCPEGFRVPTNSQWAGMVDNNSHRILGTWSSAWYDYTNYSSAQLFGSLLMLPAAGARAISNGMLSSRSSNGFYWSSSENAKFTAFRLRLNSTSASAWLSGYRRPGFSIRCVAETQMPPVLSVIPLSQNIDSVSGTTTFDISNTGAGPMTWSAVVISGSDWLSITSGENGTESGILSCEYEANTKPESRTGIIQITSPEAAQENIEVSVVQEPNEDFAKNDLIGSWLYDADGLEYSAVVTFIDDTNYMFAVDGKPDDSGGRGMERGVYNWDPSSGEMLVSASSQTAGDWGISNFNPDTLNVVISNETLRFGTDDGWIQFSKISSADNPIIGSWLYDADGLENSAVLTFIDDTNYIFAVDGEPDDGGGRGMERGTYTWNISSGAFSAAALSNTAGDWGVSAAAGTQTIFISDDMLSYNLTDDEVIQFKKIKYAEEFEDNNTECGAYISPGVWKKFDCYNLAAVGKDLGHDPFIPSWSLIGGYWQWGRKGPDSSQWHNTNTEHFAHGPTGPGSSEANEAEISGWDQTYAPNEAWSDSYKTVYDPCPTGFRVPTIEEWQDVLDSNEKMFIGLSWSSSATNYDTGLKLGDSLFLPAAGYRNRYSGALEARGYDGYYWSISENGSYDAWGLAFRSGYTGRTNHTLRVGFSVRCVAE